METKNTSSSGSDLEEPEIQKLQMQAKNLKENSLNKLNALKTIIQHLLSSNHSMHYEFREAFHQLFDANEGLFRSVLSQNMQNLEIQFSNETLHEKDSNSELRAIKGQFEHFIHLKMFELSKYNTNARKILLDFNAYTTMEAQTFKETIIQNIDSIAQCMVERASHEQELKMTLKRLNESQEVLPAESSSTDTPLEQVQNNDENNVFANERQHSEKNYAECTDERAALANLIANLTLDTEENKTILKQFVRIMKKTRRGWKRLMKGIRQNITVSWQRSGGSPEESSQLNSNGQKANTSLTQELEECKTNLDETSRALGEATSCQDSCLIALQNKQNELEKYIAFNDRTIDYEILQTKLNDTLGLLALKDIEIKRRYLNDVNARTKKPKVVPISASKPKRKANKSVATPHKKTVASDTTIQKSKSYYKELYENTNQEWKWWIAKKCPSGYKWTQKPLRTKKIWMPKIRKDDVSTSISPTIDIVSRITNVLKISNSLGSNLSNVPSSSNSMQILQLIYL
ncbi:hypothetical protein Tco_0889390 [Tanacetum coccineum]